MMSPLFQSAYEKLQLAGPVLLPLFLSCYAIIAILLGKMILFYKYRVNASWIRKESENLLEGIKTEGQWNSPDRLRLLRLVHIPKLNSGLEGMGAWVSVAPLLGLLGTVIGMIETFRMITLFGVGNPAVLADGISIALITTQTGLLIAFPGLLALNWCKNRKQKIIENIDLEIRRQAEWSAA